MQKYLQSNWFPSTIEIVPDSSRLKRDLLVTWQCDVKTFKQKYSFVFKIIIYLISINFGIFMLIYFLFYFLKLLKFKISFSFTLNLSLLKSRFSTLGPFSAVYLS